MHLLLDAWGRQRVCWERGLLERLRASDGNHGIVIPQASGLVRAQQWLLPAGGPPAGL